MENIPKSFQATGGVSPQRVLGEMISLIYLLFILWLTIGSISEAVMRAELAKLLRSEITHTLEQRLEETEKASVEKNGLLKSRELPKNTEALRPQAGTDEFTLTPDEERNAMIKNAETGMRDAKDRLDLLRYASVTLAMVNLRGDTDGKQIESVLKTLSLTHFLNRISPAEEETATPNSYSIFDHHRLELRSLSSEGLLASLLLGSGVLGALIGRIRQNSGYRLQDSITFQPLLLGASAGFICFLVLRGGKSIFLLDYSAEIQQINPYSSAFAALLSGLFTDRAYKLLSLCVDALASKIEAVVKTDLQTASLGNEQEVSKASEQTAPSSISTVSSKTRSTTKTP